MKIRKYSSLDAITKEAAKVNKEVYETTIAFYFRIFVNKQTTFLHIFYKTK
jgi:hypothetical protein